MWDIKQHEHDGTDNYKIVLKDAPAFIVETSLDCLQADAIRNAHNHTLGRIKYRKPSLWTFLFHWDQWCEERVFKR